METLGRDSIGRTCFPFPQSTMEPLSLEGLLPGGAMPVDRRDFLVQLGLATAAVRHRPRPVVPDVVLTNGHILTMDAAGPLATAVAIADGGFLAVGTDDEIAPLAVPHTGPVD